MNGKKLGFEKIVTGGQTGVDRAVLDLALEWGIPCGGWCPKGRLAEDGVIDLRYPLTETETDVYAERTELNARDSDGTLVLTFGPPTGGTQWTVEAAEKHAKPCLLLDAEQAPQKKLFQGWLREHRISVLNVAGPRESLAPGKVYSRSLVYLRELFGA